MKNDNQTLETTEPRKRRPKASFASVAILAVAILGAFNSYAIFAATTGKTPFGGSSLIQVTAAYSLGASPSLGVGQPGTTINFNLTFSNVSPNAITVALTFDSTIPQNWTADLSCTPANYPGGGSEAGFLTMTIGTATHVTPNSYVAPAPAPCDSSTHSNTISYSLIAPSGKNVVSGHVDISSNSPANLIDSLNWFAQQTA